MYFKNYSVRVFKSDGQAANENNGYVSLVNGEQYTLKLKNNDNRECVAKVFIDGKEMGNFFMKDHQEFKIERPAHDSGKLTFYTIDSVEGKQLALATEVKPDHLGLISVQFVPIKPIVYQRPQHVSYKRTLLSSKIEAEPAMNDFDDLHLSFSSPESFELNDSASMDWSEEVPKKRGGTGLSGNSNVEYKEIEIAPERFLFNEMAEIHLRLVAVESYNTVRKLTAIPMSTPIPAPI